MTQSQLQFNPCARATDPVTSHTAIADHEASGHAETHRQIVLAALRQYGGLTGRELARAIPNMEYHEVYRRLSDLRNFGQAQHGNKYVCDVAHKMCVTWWASGSVPHC